MLCFIAIYRPINGKFILTFINIWLTHFSFFNPLIFDLAAVRSRRTSARRVEGEGPSRSTWMMTKRKMETVKMMMIVST